MAPADLCKHVALQGNIVAADPATQSVLAILSVESLTWRLTLQTLTRGDGLLGMRPSARLGRSAATGAADRSGTFGARGAQVTVAWMSMVEAAGANINTASANGSQADADAVSRAHQRLHQSGLHPLPAALLQWRNAGAAHSAGLPAASADQPLWTLMQEDQFGEFWAEQIPLLQQEGWQIVVRPGFAHESVPVQAWRLVLEAGGGDEPGRAVAAPLPRRPSQITALRQPHGEGSWMLSLRIDVEGHLLDLVPLLAGLLKCERRWLDAQSLAHIDDTEIIHLRAPGGRRIHAPAAPLKAIVASMLDVLTDPRRRPGPVPLQGWEAQRLEALRLALGNDQAERAGPHGAWALQGAAGLEQLVQRLRLSGPVQAIQPPADLAITLRPYQLVGVGWLQALLSQNLSGILADDMGLGKTAQALAHLLIEQRAGRLADAPALVVVPASLVFNWRSELARMTPSLRVLTLQGPRRAQAHAAIAGHDVVITSYPLLWRDIRALEARHWHLVILDEAQFVKNAGSRTARAVRRLNARQRLCLTGTPLENHLGELWAQFDFVLPGYLGDRRSFAQQWRRPIEKNGETLRAQLLAQRVRPFILRRRKSEVDLDLPALSDSLIRLPLAGGQRALYESVRLAAHEQIRRLIERKTFAGAQIGILDALLKLRQVCCDPRLVKGSRSAMPPENAKLEWLREHLPLLATQGRRMLVFSQFTELLGLIEPELDALALPWLSLTGQTPTADRGALVARYQSGQVPVLLASLKAGGVGLNLTAADTVIHLDPWWNPAVAQQATARAHRIGQDRPVLAYHLLIEGSIEQRLVELQARKQALADGVLGSDAALALKFDRADLDGLLQPLLEL